ncbi:RNA-directed DNA polymerase, eukaryota [Tanacetum coccineum]
MRCLIEELDYRQFGNGFYTSFWFDGLDWRRLRFIIYFAFLLPLEEEKNISVALKLNSSLDQSFRRCVRDGIESQQMTELKSMLNMVSLSNSRDRWRFDLTGDGEFRVKEVRNFIDDLFLPSFDATRWVKCIPIKINIFVWRARRDCLPTRVNLARRGVYIESNSCPTCRTCEEDIHHSLFQCDLAQSVLHRICRWWDFPPNSWTSFMEWQSWFSSVRLASKVKILLEGVFYVAWILGRMLWPSCEFSTHQSLEKLLVEENVPNVGCLDSNDEVAKIREKFDLAKQRFLNIPDALEKMAKMNPKGIYVNKKLRLDSLQVYVLDYDYTFAHYSPSLQNLIYDIAKQHLGNEVSRVTSQGSILKGLVTGCLRVETRSEVVLFRNPFGCTVAAAAMKFMGSIMVTDHSEYEATMVVAGHENSGGSSIITVMRGQGLLSNMVINILMLKGEDDLPRF